MSEKCQTRTSSIAEVDKTKAARRRLLNSNPMIVDQAALSSQIVEGSILRNNRATPPVVDAGGDDIDVLLDPIDA
jgi:hypothetical protein